MKAVKSLAAEDSASFISVTTGCWARLQWSGSPSPVGAKQWKRNGRCESRCKTNANSRFWKIMHTVTLFKIFRNQSGSISSYELQQFETTDNNIPTEVGMLLSVVSDCCNIPTFEALLGKSKSLFLERCRKSNNVCLRALMQSDFLYSSLFFEHYTSILLCDWAIELCSVRLINGVSSQHAFVFYLDSTKLVISALFRSSAVTSVTC